MTMDHEKHSMPPDPPSPAARWMVRGALVVAALLVRLACHLLSEPWHLPTEALRAFRAGLLVMLAVSGVGLLLLEALRPWRRLLPRPPERLVLAPLVGALPVSLAVLATGLIGFHVTLLVAGAAVGGTLSALCGYVLFFRSCRLRRRHPNPRRTAEAPPRWIWILPALVFALALPYALAPATESDALRYHLAVPATWLRDLRIHYLPHQAFSNFPMLAEMLFLPAMALGGPSAARLLHLLWLPVVMALITRLARLMCPTASRTSWPLAAGLGFAFIPTVPILAAWGFIDMFLVAYVLGFAWICAQGIKHRQRLCGSLVGWIGAGALGLKYTMLPLFALFGVVWVLCLLIRRLRGDRIFRAAGLALLFALLLGSPWYLKNAQWTGNPVYPLAWSLFGGGQWSADHAHFYMSKAAEKGMPWAETLSPAPLWNIVEFLASPVTTTFYFTRFENHPLGPIPLAACLLVIAWALAAYRRHQRASLSSSLRWTRAWVVSTLLLFWGLWFLTYQSNRLLLPAIALVLALAGSAGSWFRSRMPHPDRTCLTLLALAATLVSLAVYLVLLSLGPSDRAITRLHGWAAGLGFVDRRAYLARAVDYWSAAQWLERRINPGHKVLLVGEHRTLYFDYPHVASDWFDTPQPLPWIRATADNDRLLERLHEADIRYIFFNYGELGKYAAQYLAPDSRFPRFTPAEWRRFWKLWDHPRLQQIYPRARHEDIYIYRIRPPEATNPSPPR